MKERRKKRKKERISSQLDVARKGCTREAWSRFETRLTISVADWRMAGLHPLETCG
jgi:hypothetical protein